MTGSNDARAIRRAAFGQMKTWTQAIKQLPSDDVLLRKALVAVRQVTYENPLDLGVSRSLAKDVARYIRTNFDASKRRPAPRSTREKRSLRNEAIISASEAARISGKPKSTRHLAVEFDLTPSQISRILRQAADQWRKCDQSHFDNDLVAALRLLDKIQPKDGQCVVTVDFLLDSIELSLPAGSTSNAIDLIEMVEGAKRGWWFKFAGEFVVVSKGRRLTREAAASLVSRRSVRHDQPSRVLQDFGRQVWADLFAVLSVIEERATAGDWRVFLGATIFSYRSMKRIESSTAAMKDTEARHIRTLVCDDPEALVTRVRKALRLRQSQDYFDAIRMWNREYEPHASVLSSVLGILGLTRDSEWTDALRIWMNICCYGERVRAGLLAGRDVSDIDVFMQALEDADGDTTEMIELLRSATGG